MMGVKPIVSSKLKAKKETGFSIKCYIKYLTPYR